MSYRYICNHCDKRFESEDPEPKECPACFWTSSVKREDELAAEKKPGPTSNKRVGAGLERLVSVLKLFAKIVLIFALLAGVGFLGLKIYRRVRAASPGGSQAISISFSKDPKAAAKTAAVAGIDALSAQEKEILAREIPVTASRTLGPSEQEILQKTVKLQTGWAEHLPSAAWTLDQYMGMIQNQETAYKMPFARSYKKKLEELFKAKYLPAADAFAKGDILAARNLWMESLGFPLYSKDLLKHRAVALVMLRPFTNDTLAKISAMNQSLADRDLRAQEEVLGAQYQKLMGLIAEKKWNEAFAAAGELEPLVRNAQQKAKVQAPLPQYPASFANIDADIQRPLMGLMNANPPTVADLQPLQQDLIEKKEILETFTEGYVSTVTATYQSALALIRKEKWQEAIPLLESIRGPQPLIEDAARKIAILKKIIPPALDSGQKTS
ncbi:MAG TPA: hypothetical protein PLL75_06670 [Candidatus Omnitrophota bacterium]|nr:hypothetical protein [Candidatus Omnitrophota bacterium]HPS37391.1 hypothetical protein [Candidatus Omnitrophota bacterium]